MMAQVTMTKQDYDHLLRAWEIVKRVALLSPNNEELFDFNVKSHEGLNIFDCKYCYASEGESHSPDCIWIEANRLVDVAIPATRMI